MAQEQRAGRFAGTLADLETSAHVPVADQLTAQSEPPTQGPLAPEELDRQRLLGVTSAGRLRLP